MMTKDVLEYTEDELRSLSDDELEGLLALAENGESLYNTRQLVEKTMINSLYGAMANKWFPLFNESMAAAITGNGRFFIQKLAKNIESTLQGLMQQEKPYIVYGDTDSVVGDTLIRTEFGEKSIEHLYNDLDGEIEIRGENNFIKHISNPIKAASVDKNLQFNIIISIM